MEINSSFPKVSILIPCYNAERWIGQAIESALAQTWSNKEVIVYDDGSTDGSRDVINVYGGKIRHEFGPNCGGNHCRNRLLELASGEWAQFLDADDYLLPDKVSKQMEISTGADVIYGPILLRTEKSEIANERFSIPDLGADLYDQWIRWQVCQTGGVLWRREALLQIGGWNESFVCCQDNEICLRAIKARFKFAYCPEPGAVYRIWSEGTVCRKNPWQLILTKTRLIDEMLEWLGKTKKIKSTHIKIAGRAYFDMAKKIADYDRNESIKYAQKYKARGLFDPGNSGIPFWMTYHLLGFETALLITPLWRKIKSVLS